MELSIIIVSWRVKDLLKECLTSIFNNVKNTDYEVVVIDNDSGDGTVEMVQENFPQVKLTGSRINLGFARANNLGIEQSSGKYILLLNPDTKLINCSLEKAVKFMDKNSDVGILGCKLLNHDLTVQPSVRRFPRFVDHLLMMFKLHHFFSLKKYLALDFDYGKTQAVDQVMGAFFMIKRKVIEKIGLFDQDYYIWFEEVDYCQRAKKAGFRVVYYADTQIIHYYGQSFKQVLNVKNQWIFSKSRLRYILKHQNLLIYIIILILTPISLLLSLISIKKS